MMPVNWDFCKNRKGTLKDQTDLVRPKKIKNLAQVEWHDFKRARAELKAMLPIIPLTEVKRFHLQNDEAVMDELMEKNLQKEASILKELVEFDEERRRAAGPGTPTWTKPRLRDQKELLDRLKEAFFVIADARKSGDLVKAMNTWIKISLFFQSQGENWWWLTKKLYENTVKEIESLDEYNGQNITIARYLYGRFLFMIETDWPEALKFLDIAREASAKRIWNASKILGEKQETIFRESCALIYKILIALVRDIGHEDPNFAVQACKVALERATDTGHDDYVIDSLYESGRNHLRYGDVKQALQSFTRLLIIAKKIPDPEGICNAHMELAFAYKEVNDTANTEKHLSLLRENAVQFNLPYKLAQAHYYTGEHFLNQMKATLATAHLEKAFTLYYDLGSIDEADRARIITGISRGQERIKQYINLILQCGQHGGPDLLKLCTWKSNRDIFWIDSRHDITDDLHEYCEDPIPPVSSSSTHLTRTGY